MELTPDLLLEAKFSSARRGYDMAEVDDFLERCAEGLDVLLTRLRSEFDRAERAESELDQMRRGGAPAPEPSVEAPAVESPVSSPFEDAPAPAPAPSADEPMRILIAAERTAEAAIADARAEAERIRSEAESIAGTQRSEAETLLARAKAEAEAEARRAGDEAKRAIQTEVVTLRRDRDALSDDIRALRRWLDDQRTRLRTTARDLQRLAEDPSALRDVPVPEIATSPETDAEGVADTAQEAWRADDESGAPAPEAVDEDVDQIGDTDGEPTQAVPMADPFVPFDDDRAEDSSADTAR